MPESTDLDFPGEMQANSLIIDAALAKCNFIGTRAPGVGDDEADGYSAGSKWYDTVGGKIYQCFGASTGFADWKQIWPAKTSDMDMSSYAPAAKGVTNGDSHDHYGGDGSQVDYAHLANIPSTFTPAAHNQGAETITTNTLDGDRLPALSTGKKGGCPATGAPSGKFLKDNGTWDTPAGGDSASFWNAIPGSPARASNNTFTCTDTGNANKYDLLFKKRVVVRWKESTVDKKAMVASSVYNSNTVTVTIKGDTMASIDAGTLKYCSLLALNDLAWLAPAVLAVVTDGSISKKIRADCDRIPFCADFSLGTGGATSGSTTLDIYDDTVSIYSTATKPSIAYNNSPLENVNMPNDNTNIIAEGSYLTIGITTVPGTASSSDAYVVLYTIPASWMYRT